MRFMVTGFGPFRDVVDNPSFRLACALDQNAVQLPVQYGKVEAFARSVSAETILCLGLNARATELKFELYAHNQIGADKGHGSRQHSRTIIRKSGPRTLGQTLASPAQLPNLPMATSFTPGDYLCNFLLYSLLIRYPERRIGFVHVPPFETKALPKQLGALEELITYLALRDH